MNKKDKNVTQKIMQKKEIISQKTNSKREKYEILNNFLQKKEKRMI